MNRLARIVRSATPSTAVKFCKQPYGKSGVEQFLRDVIAMANAAVDGPRYIITGVELDAEGRRCMHGVNRGDFSGKPAYQALANEHIEPPIRIQYQPVSVDGEQVGVFEIADCQDRPYMMRIDYSETLRRGDAFARIKTNAVKLGRRQLQALFEKKFQDSVSATSIEIGFPGEIIHKDLHVMTHSLAQLPSAVAGAKLHELIEAKQQVAVTATNTFLERLTHARLFGSDCPYENRSVEEIHDEMRQIERRYRDHDNHFLFEERATLVQLVLLNQGNEKLNDASLTLVMPKHPALHVGAELPRIPRDDEFIERTPGEQAGYPSVSVHDNSVQVSVKLGDIEPGEPTEVFELPLRICVGNELEGRRTGIRYALHAHNLRSAAKGKLRLVF
ncbi:MAG: ATP-binding protein [Woeseiaceae bacterium]|nr:ATP-binding protein [Woeseiaceae bacterium]